MSASEIVKWCFVAWFVLAGLIVIGQVGKPKKPTTPGVAVATVLILGLEVFLVLTFWGGGPR